MAWAGKEIMMPSFVDSSRICVESELLKVLAQKYLDKGFSTVNKWGEKVSKKKWPKLIFGTYVLL